MIGSMGAGRSVYDRYHSAYYVTSHGKVYCRAGKAGNLPLGLLFSVYSYVQLISDLLQICTIVFNITIFKREICSDIEDLKDFCKYL